MLRLIVCSLVASIALGTAAEATCTPPANGTTADATALNTYLSCEFAPLVSPNFTGESSLSGTFTNTSADDTPDLFNISLTLAPAASSASNFRSFIMSTRYDTGSAFTATGTNAPTAAWFETRVTNAGTIAETDASEFWGLWAGSDAASLGTVSDVEAIKVTPALSYGNSLTSTLTKIVGVHVQDSQKNTFSITGQAGIQIDSQAAATNNTALLMGQTTVPTGNFAIYDASANNSYFSGKVGIGTSSPAQKLEVNGEVKVDTFGSATSSAVCQLSGVLSSCSSSIRYKENVRDATFGLKDVEQMRPVTFKWKGRDENDIGLIAEEVAKINPLFATYKDGKVEGVKYAQLTAVLVNAIKQLKNTNDGQAVEIADLKTELDAEGRQLRQIEAKLNVRAAQNNRQRARVAYAADRR